jgi:hypothetical protein
MQGGKNWILPKEMNANRFFRDSHWLEIWKNCLCPSMGPSVAMDLGDLKCSEVKTGFCRRDKFKPVLLRLSLAGNLEKPCTYVPLWDEMEGAQLWLWTLCP